MERQAIANTGGVGTDFCWRALVLGTLLLLASHLNFMGPAAAQDLISIGLIQGGSDSSSYVDQQVRFRGIVTGILEDENASGTRFYTVYVQDVPGSQDGDPLSSDGLAIFVGARRPWLAAGDIAVFGGTVTEFYGLTEIDNNGFTFSIESRNNPLPDPILIDPPADNDDSAAYLERFEGMRVAVPKGTVVGPSHVGCGFSVVRQENGVTRVVVRSDSDPRGQIIGVLHPTDVNCVDMPAVATGDEIDNITGPLTYHFDRFKIVYQDLSEIAHRPVERDTPAGPPRAQEGQWVMATFNVNNYFDSKDDTGSDAELKPTSAEVSMKQAKIAAAVADGLNCPEVLGIQEVENERLLSELAWRLADRCGFVYQISHLESPDSRGAELALLSQPERVLVTNVSARQGCTELDTGVIDPGADCPEGQQPLFSRPPLQIEILVDGQPISILVNHFKSKREGDEETSERRLAQAEHVNGLARQIRATQTVSNVVVMGDFNDYDGSSIMRSVEGEGDLVDALAGIPAEERYSYIFDGASQLIDWILISPELVDNVVAAGIVHSSADYPDQLGQSLGGDHLALRPSDHDVPYVVMGSRTRATPLAPTLQAPTPDDDPTAQRPGQGPTRESVVLAVTGEPTAEAGGDSARSGTADQSPVVTIERTLENGKEADQGGSPARARVSGSATILNWAGFVILATVLALLVAAIRRRN